MRTAMSTLIPVVAVGAFLLLAPMANASLLLSQSFESGETVNYSSVGVPKNSNGFWDISVATVGGNGPNGGSTTFTNLDGTQLWAGNGLKDSTNPALTFDSVDNGGLPGYVIKILLGSDKTSGSWFSTDDAIRIGYTPQGGSFTALAGGVWTGNNESGGAGTADFLFRNGDESDRITASLREVMYMISETLPIVLEIQTDGIGGLAEQIAIDAVRISTYPESVPEPSLGLLLGISLVGLVGVGAVRKIKRKKVANT